MRYCILYGALGGCRRLKYNNMYSSRDLTRGVPACSYSASEHDAAFLLFPLCPPLFFLRLRLAADDLSQHVLEDFGDVDLLPRAGLVVRYSTPRLHCQSYRDLSWDLPFANQIDCKIGCTLEQGQSAHVV